VAAPRQWADLLRALGRSLDAQNAGHIEILNRDAFLSVFWDAGAPGADQRAYQEHDLEALRAAAREMRSGSGGNPGGSLAEMLRTLGQELDANQVDLSRVAEVATGFEVSGEAGGKYFRRVYMTEELVGLGAQRRAARPTGILLLKRVSMGADVYAKDDQRLGKLKDIRGNFFRIATPFLQRDYWLPGDCVASVGPGERVLLWVTKAQAETRKSESDPPKS